MTNFGYSMPTCYPRLVDLDITSNDYNNDNNNLESFYNGIMVFMPYGDDVGGHCIVCITMYNWSPHDGGDLSDTGNNRKVARGLKVRVDPMLEL